MPSFPTAPLGIFMDDGNKPSPHGYGVNWNDPLTKNLVGYWPMWEGAGSLVTDATGKNRDLVNSGADSIPSEFGPVLSLTGSDDDFLAGPHIPELGTGEDITFSIRVNMPVLSTVQWLMAQYNPSPGQGPILFLVNDLLLWRVGVDNVNAAIPSNEWVHIVTTAVGSILAIYLDGVQKASASRTRADNTSTTFNIGGPQGFAGVSSMNGLACDAAAWNRRLSVDEINELVDNPFRFIRPGTMPLAIAPQRVPVFAHHYSQMAGA